MSIRPHFIIATAAIALALPATTALAQTSATAADDPSQLLAPAAGLLQQPEIPELKSEGAAFSLSLLGTLIPMLAGFAMAGSDSYDASGETGAILIYTGLYIGPSLGFFYAGRTGRGLASCGLRNGIGLVTLVGAFAICGPMDYCDDSEAGVAAVMLLGGAIGVLSSAIYDIATIQRTVRERNEKELARRVALVPTYSRWDGPGFRVSVRVR